MTKAGSTYVRTEENSETDAKWEAWIKENNANEDETPYGLLKRLRAEDKWMDIAKVTPPPDRTADIWDIELSEFMRL